MSDPNAVYITTSRIDACVACAPREMPRKEVEEQVNVSSPTGISSRWTITRKRTFPGGEPHPAQCEQDRDRVHYLLHC